MSHVSWESVKLRHGILFREHFGAKWKTQIGYTIWDNSCGPLLNLEDTYGWSQAVDEANSAEDIEQWVKKGKGIMVLAEHGKYHTRVPARGNRG